MVTRRPVKYVPNIENDPTYEYQRSERSGSEDVLRKRNRHQEELEGKHNVVKPYWTKSVIDVDNCTLFGRTPLSWAKILLYFLIFYLCLALLSFICFYVFYTSLNKEAPRRKMSQPGCSVIPCVDMKNCVIEYNEHRDSEIDPLTKRLYDFLAKYGTDDDHINMGECAHLEEYGYQDNEPCFLLKINRIIGFKVDPYTEVAELPSSAPQSLKDAMNDEAPDGETRVWISCDAVDSSSPVSIEFYPNPYVLSKYLEHTAKIEHAEGKLYDDSDFNRIVAFKVNGVTLNHKITIECFLWAKNIVQNFNKNEGVVRFWLKVLNNEERLADL